MTAPLSAAQLTGLAGGHGDAATVAVLRGGQLGRRRLLTVAAARACHGEPLVRQSLDLLTRAEHADRAAVAAVLAHPPVTGWARAALDGAAGPAYLAALAAAAATRAGLTFTLTLPRPADGVLPLPTVGAATGLPLHSPVRLCGEAGTLRIDAGRGGAHDDGVRIEAGGGRLLDAGVGGIGWLPVRRTTPFHAVEVLVDDQDPWRDCYHRPSAARLDDVSADRLDRLTVEAGQWLRAHLPAHADALAGLLRTLVPLRPPPSGNPVSATSRDALGAIALSVPADARTLALLLVHELQHTKLGALLDLVPLHRAGGPARYRAPWRLDPRPVGALLQGAYAHLGVAEVWRCRRHEGTAAAFEYAYWREQTIRAVRQLADAAELTAAGRAFVADMANTLRGWRDAVDGAVEAAVRDVADAGAVRWGLANLVPDPDEVERLAYAWRQGVPPDVCRSVSTVVPAAARPALTVGSGPEGAVRHRLLGSGGLPGSTPSDQAYAAGKREDALAGYRRRVAADCGDVDAWVGLALSAHHTGQPAAAGVLTSRPELVRALGHTLPDADPLALAAWLAPPTPPIGRGQ
ncbi:HEXXH motif-containing putative peptide modification protein [Micromonospora lupini]|uniref:aKG-HExxH-type peptide beta-hydroxylase n=1 Tax=Micromonospora lupini TaxID=285679 RepID=UPI002255EEAE|nr:HEXXH motif-containing putative peptide modification protein [Micromonospora lupini]MCX5065309.1 HEXXH motif-containing putative peptide modification protein [Micromonospora lupini]